MTRKPAELFEDDRYCFVCGEENPIGLNLDWNLSEDGERLSTSFVPDKQWQGWKDVVHGGIISTVLDEIMVNHGIYGGNPLVSVELSVRFKTPARIGEEIRFEGYSRPLKGRLYEGKASAHQGETLIARAESKLMKVEAEVPEVWEND